MSRTEAISSFQNLGGSWKKANNTSKNGSRHLHGKEGRGRLRALALGRVAEWTVTGKTAEGSLESFTVSIIRDDVRAARIGPSMKPERGTKAGTRVRITELDKDWRLDAPGVAQQITELFALYMTEYPDVFISVDGHKINPAAAISHTKSYDLPAIEWGSESFPASLEVIEWKRPTDRMLYLCDEGGLPLHRIPPTIQAPGFEFSAYLKSPYNSRLNEQGTLDLGELDTGLTKAIEDSKDKLRAHFKARQAEDTRSLVERNPSFCRTPASMISTLCEIFPGKIGGSLLFSFLAVKTSHERLVA